MAGCCGQGPVIVSGAASAPRLDVETQLMCDVLPDGTIAATILVEPIYDTNTGARVATRITDPATGEEYTPAGEIQVCPTSQDCESPTTPVTSVGLCLADGTPIAVTITRDCTGATTSEGWINLTTGAYSAGAPPAGTVACGSSQSIEVSGTFCDIDEDGEVVGLVLVEYSYDADGAIAAVRLVDAVTGDTYTPAGTVTVCPAGVAQPERDLLQLCDTAGDGTVTAFVRDYARDENGAIVGHSDYGLDGAPYTPAGTVGQCSSNCHDCEQLVLCDVVDDASHTFLRTMCRDCTGAVTSVLDTELDGATLYEVTGTVDVCQPTDCDTTAICVRPSGVVEFISNAANLVDGSADPVWTWSLGSTNGPWYDMYRVGVYPGWTAADPGTPGGTAHWVAPHPNSGTANTGLPNEGPTFTAGNGDWYARASFELPSFADPATIRVSATILNADQLAVEWRLNAGAWQAVNRAHTQPPYTLPPMAVPGAKAGLNEIFLHARETVFNAPASGLIMHLVVTYDVAPDAYEQWLRITCTDGTVYYLDPQGDRHDGIPDGHTIVTCPGGSESSSGPEQDLVTLCDTTPDGTVTAFVRDYARDENGAIVGHSDYDLDGAPYTPTGTVGVCGAAEECRDTSTVLVCDVPADSSTAITPTFVDGVTADTGQTQFQNHPGPYTALWSGGTFVYPAGAGPAQEHLTATGQLTADLAGCDGAAGTVTISVRVRNDGPTEGQAWDGALRLFRGTTLIAAHNALEWAPAGWQGTLTVSAPVTAAEVASGDIRVALTLETYHLGAKAWTADQFTAALELEGCEVTSATQFLRTLVTDCETGEVVSTTDTTLDGQPYTVTGTVGQCQPASSGPSECRDCEQTVLCDVTADEGTHSFLRTVCRDCTGAVISVLDTELDGTTPYAPVGTVGSCGPDGCPTTSVQTIRLCDLDPTVEADEDGRRCAVPFLRHLAYDCAGALLGFHDTGLDGTTPYTPTQVVDCQCESGQGITSSIEVPWQVVSLVEDPAGLPQQDFIYTVAPETDPTRIGTMRVHVSRPAGGACGAYDINNLVFSNTAAYTLTLDTVAQEMSYLRVDLVDFDTFEPVAVNTAYPLPDRLGGTAGWNATNTRIVPSENNGTGYMYWDNPPETVGWSVLNQGGGTSCSALSFQGMTVEPGGCCGGDEGGCSDCGPVETGVRAVTGTTAQDLVAEFPGLQSISVAVLAGMVNVTMSDGTDVPIPAGVTLTWSVAKDTDTALAAASFAGADGSASYLLNWTRS
ncbi:hypothetical protein PV392_16370 [Streptomyces sp. ME03-5709C]|nr:hypothetical protein [Streptomyces sp. ME03-5709C]